MIIIYSAFFPLAQYGDFQTPFPKEVRIRYRGSSRITYALRRIWLVSVRRRWSSRLWAAAFRPQQDRGSTKGVFLQSDIEIGGTYG